MDLLEKLNKFQTQDITQIKSIFSRKMSIRNLYLTKSEFG